jgi:hypothetical protein
MQYQKQTINRSCQKDIKPNQQAKNYKKSKIDCSKSASKRIAACALTTLSLAME